MNANSGIVHFLRSWEGLRSSKIEKTQKTRGKCKKKTCKKNANSGIVHFLHFWEDLRLELQKFKKLQKLEENVKKNAPPKKTMQKKCKFWNCACLVKTQISRSCICFCIFDCMFFAFSWATVLGLHFLGACVCIFLGILIKFYHL